MEYLLSLANNLSFFAGYLRFGNVYNPVVYGILHNPRNGDLLTRVIHQLRFVGGSALDINHGKSQEKQWEI